MSLRSIDDPSIYAHAFINPEDNADNLPKGTLDELQALPRRHYARFYKGIYQAEIDGALWTFETIEHARCLPEDVPRDLKRVVVSVDPSGTRGDEEQRSDNVGIIAVGLGMDNTAYVLADRTCNLPPEAWALIRPRSRPAACDPRRLLPLRGNRARSFTQGAVGSRC